MPIEFKCECGKRIRAKDEILGRKIRCPECSAVLVVPNTSTSPTDATSAKSRQRPRQGRTAPRKLSGSRSGSQEPKGKETYTGKQKAVIIILCAIIFSIPAINRYRSRANRAPSRSASNVAAKPTPELKQDALSVLERTARKYGIPKEGWGHVIVNLEYEQLDEVRNDIMTKSGAKQSSTTYAGRMLIAKLEIPDVAELASKISFGRVLNVDESARTILVDAKAESGGDSAAD